MANRIEEVIQALAEKRFISPHPENNLTRAREWVRQHQKEVDIICQLFPQPLDDKELREKIARELHKQMYGSQDQWEMNPYEDLAEDVRNYLLLKADQILALLPPKIEEARRQGYKEGIERVKIEEALETSHKAGDGMYHCKE